MSTFINNGFDNERFEEQDRKIMVAIMEFPGVGLQINDIVAATKFDLTFLMYRMEALWAAGLIAFDRNVTFPLDNNYWLTSRGQEALT